MPLMLDNAVPVNLPDVDDLFGENVPLALPVKPQSKKLRQRLDELRAKGCCQRVAWSRLGTIASVTADGQLLQLRFLRCSPDNGSWGMSEATACEQIRGSRLTRIVHVEWASTSSPELAIIDSRGHVAIASFPIALNQLFVARNWSPDQPDDCNPIVGCYWLPVAPPHQQKPYHVIYGPARKHPAAFMYETSFVHAAGPSHPHASKSALFCITMNGWLKMFWSQNTQKTEETAMELDSVNCTADLITHAALTSDKKAILIALATSSLSLKLLKVEIQWGGPGSSSERNPMPPTARLNPALVETRLAMTTLLHDVAGESVAAGNARDITHLKILPSVVDNTGKNTVLPLILAVRSRPVNQGSYQSIKTVLDRWEVVEYRSGLDPDFAQLSNRRNSVPLDPPVKTRLHRLGSVTINKVVISVEAIQFGKALILTMSDGTVEYRDRGTLEELYTSEDLSKIMNLRQVGWTFADTEACLQVAFSPTYCSMMQMREDGAICWAKLHYPAGDLGESMKDAHYSGSIAGLAVTVASSLWYQSNFDDTLAIVYKWTGKRRFVHDWVTELIRILKIQVDYSEEMHHDALMRNSPLQSCLGIMNSLGFKGEMAPRSFQSKFSTICLQIRNVVILITLSSNTPVSVRDKLSPLDEHEVVDALAGCAQWSLDLLSWLVKKLMSLMRDDEFRERLAPPRFAQMTAYLQQNNDVSLHLVLSSCSRGFLSAICRRIAHLQVLSTRAIEFYRKQPTTTDPTAIQLQRAYHKMHRITSTAPINVAEVEKLLNVVGSDIRQTYQESLPNWVKSGPNAPQGKQVDAAVKTAQVQFEAAMLLGISPPPAFLPLIKKLMDKELPALKASTDQAKIFFGNYLLLGLDDGDSSERWRRQSSRVHLDMFKRIAICLSPQGPPWRRCTRCASVMEDVFTNRPGFSFVLGQQRRCSCGGSWALLPAGKRLL
ncbi:hypothetical protein CDD82_4064 [Ophiocordyceps australis]|uniref:Mediator of RNA polymerase II transcription subunit 16 n=1 Tax=Ophiocordyceps australis TaxID=1399860 RepID=A0A2C5Z370_9HYPO|nr:hypothetical protein CDD82_4064 [Ophiocordyceps australis]